MLDPKLRILISRLLERTEHKELEWHEGITEDEFQVDFPKYSVSLSLESDQDDAGWVTMTIQSGKGTVIETLYERPLRQDGDTHDLGVALDNLYGMARRQALGVDQAIDELLEEIG